MNYKPNLNAEEARTVLTNLEAFITRFERTQNVKITDGARKLIEEILLDAIKPKELN